MNTKVISSLAAIAVITGSAFAGPPAHHAPVAPAPDSFYRAGEVTGSVAFMLGARSGSLGPNATWQNTTRPGADIELKYLITRNFGVGLEQEYVAVSKPLWGTAVNAYLRAPLHEGSQWAPYLFGGFGGLYGGGEGRFEGHGGAGISYRFTPKLGMFADGRQVWVDGSGDNIPRFGLFRLGFDFVF